MRTTTARNSASATRAAVTEAPIALKALIVLVGGMALFFGLISAVTLGYDQAHKGSIFPGVSVAGVQLAGMNEVEAAVAMAQQVAYPQTGRIVFQDDPVIAKDVASSVWEVRPADLGLTLDLDASVHQAYNLGRVGNPLRKIFDQLGAWHNGRDLPLLMTYDENQANAYLARLAAQVDRPMVEASLGLNGVEVVANVGQVGRQVDIRASLASVEGQLGTLVDGLLPLVVTETPPVVLETEGAAEQARRILSTPLVLSIPEAGAGDPTSITIEPKKLAELISFQRVDTSGVGTFEIKIAAEKLRRVLEETAPHLARRPENARFIFNDDTRQLDLLKPAVIGRSLNIENSLQVLQTELLKGNHAVNLAVDTTNPQAPSDATAASLGIRELVSKQTSYFYGSSSPRIQNIETASAQFHGLLVAPGQTFSMSDALGDVSLDNGYAEALIILGDRTIKGVGGGVCQVSTTLFRTVFFGGYPIDERHSHAYRVGYYEQNATGNLNPDLAGLDATVFVPLVDFKFTNDTPNWLLMETYVNTKARTLTWKFYSTSDGRTVKWDTSGLQNIVDAPPPEYVENPDLAAGETRQVDWEVAGADVTVWREVYRDGDIYIRDEFYTHYQPWRAIIEYGPGTKIKKNQ
jgi:vancomycin resistance protein YoaR